MAEEGPDKVVDRQGDNDFAARRDVIQLAAALVQHVTLTKDLVPLLFRSLPLHVAVCLVPCPSKRLTQANCSGNSASMCWNRRDPCGRGEP